MSIRRKSSQKKKWAVGKLFRLSARFDWDFSSIIKSDRKQYTIYAIRYFLRHDTRFNFLLYNVNDEKLIGRINLIFFTSCRGSQVYVLVILHMCRIPPHSDSAVVVTNLGHLHYAYQFRPDSDDDIVLDCIFAAHIFRPESMIFDMHKISKLYNLKTIPSALHDNSLKLRQFNLFLLKVVQ